MPDLVRNGDVIAARRRQRGLSRKALAELVGRSDEWLRQIETGKRKLDSVECTLRLASILHVDPAALLGLSNKPSSQPDVDDELFHTTQQTLMDSLAAFAFAEEPSWADGEPQLDSMIAEAWRNWLHSPHRYAATAALLPKVLRAAAVRAAKYPHEPRALRAAISSYQLATVVLDRVGQHQLAWLAADRSMRIAEATKQPLLRAAAGYHLASCYLRAGRYVEAATFATAIIRQLNAAASTDNEETATLTGALHLVAAEAKAAQAELHEAEQLINTATSIAQSLGADRRTMNIPFGPTEVGISAVHVAIRLGRLGEAIRLAAGVDLPDDYPPDGQIRHFVPLAYVHARRNEDASAVLALTRTAEVSPEDLRYDELARQTIVRLLRRNNLTVRRELKRLAELAKPAIVSALDNEFATSMPYPLPAQTARGQHPSAIRPTASV